MTKKQLVVEKLNNLQYFDEELVPVKDKWEEIIRSGEKPKEAVDELIIVNSLMTIEMEMKWRENNNKSEWKQNFYYTKITNEKSKTDGFGIIKKWGMKMTPEEFEMYKDIYNEYFILE